MKTKHINHWTPAELHFLEKNYGFMPTHDIAVYLSRHSLSSIYQKASAYGLTQKYPEAKEYHSPKFRNMTVMEQAYEMGMSYSAVWANRGKKVV